MAGVLVTGANGFVGRQVCRRLAEDGLPVVGAVRVLPNEALAGVDTRRVADIGPDTDWRAPLAGIDAVVHCAARVHVRKERAPDPLAAFRRVNVAGTERLAAAAAEAGVRRFLLISSIGAETAARAAAEGTAAGPYQQSKWEGEEALRRVAGESGMTYAILRPPLVYGRGAPGNFARLRAAITAGLPLPLASLDNRRSLIYVDNLSDAVRHCLDHPGAAGRTFAVSDGEALSTPQLVRLMAAALGRPARLFPFPPALLKAVLRAAGLGRSVEGLFESLVIDNAEISAATGWRPPHSLAEAIAASLAP